MREQDRRSSTGREEEENVIWDKGENGKTKDTRTEKKSEERNVFTAMNISYF